jgi:murein DD-endopeptidase MepM/ murein hydrolase activator NlpD
VLLLPACSEVEVARSTYRVQPQDTLYSIAWRLGLNYRDLARWNGIGEDFHISVGQLLVLSPSASVASPPPKPTPPVAAPPPIRTSGFGWPTAAASPPRAVQGGGILIPGVLGQAVRATRGGRVVYNGNAIRGYGNLIIIKHDEQYLSAYAHNSDSLVREGENVSAGQLIAHMGESALHQPVLYFEIRDNGKPVDPLLLLSPK